MAKKKYIVGVTACQIGIAHTFATGAEHVITDEDIARADGAIVAADVKIKGKERFDPVPTLSCKTKEVMTKDKAAEVVAELLEAIG